MHPLLLSAEFDPFQAAIIVIAVIASFVKWLWENWQQRRGTPPPLDPEEQSLREDAWRRQTGQPPPQRPASPIAAPRPVATPWDELRKVWREAQAAARPAPPSQRPAHRPPPVPQQRPAEQAPPQPARVVPSPVPVVPPPSVARSTSPTLAALHRLRHDPALMRQAILMHEILGPPKALQTDSLA